MKWWALICATAIILLAIIAITILVLENRPLDNVIPLALAVITPTVATLLAYAGLAEKLDIVHGKVNGNLEQEKRTNEALTERLAQLTDKAIENNIEPSRVGEINHVNEYDH